MASYLATTTRPGTARGGATGLPAGRANAAGAEVSIRKHARGCTTGGSAWHFIHCTVLISCAPHRMLCACCLTGQRARLPRRFPRPRPTCVRLHHTVRSSHHPPTSAAFHPVLMLHSELDSSVVPCRGPRLVASKRRVHKQDRIARGRLRESSQFMPVSRCHE